MKILILFITLFNIFQFSQAQTNFTNQGSSNQVTVEQIDTAIIKGPAGPAAIIGGDFNQISIFQGTSGWGVNQVELQTSNNFNIIEIRQARNEFNFAQGVNGHFVSLINNGYNISFISQQTNDDTGQHVIFSSINGNNNSATIFQKNNNTKTLNLSVTGNNNQIQSLQEGIGSHQTNINLFGSGHSVNVNQKGVGNHSADLNLTNSGGAISVNLLQQGSINQSYSLTQTCSLPSGCANTIVQGQ